MKVLLVVRWPVGGIRTYIRYIYSQRIFSDYEFTILAPDLEFSEFLEVYLAKANVRFIPTPNSDKAIMSAVRSIIQKEEFDLIHSHGYSAGMLTVGANLRGKPRHIMTAHDVYRDEQFRGLKGKAKQVAINLAFSRLTRVLTVGEDCYSNFKDFMPLVRTKKLYNIDHGVDVHRFANALPRAFREELSLPESKKIIGFLGRFMSQKGFMDLVKAIEILSKELSPAAMPVVLTFGWGGFIREDFSVIEKLGLSQHFIQLPFTDDVPSVIKGVDMVVMPSRWEACGLLAMEVLAAGTPLVGTSCIGLRCVLEGSPAHIVEPYNPKALSRAIAKQLTTDESAFKTYQPTAVERFDMERPAVELHKHYQALCSSKQKNTRSSYT